MRTLREQIQDLISGSCTIQIEERNQRVVVTIGEEPYSYTEVLDKKFAGVPKRVTIETTSDTIVVDIPKVLLDVNLAKIVKPGDS